MKITSSKSFRLDRSQPYVKREKNKYFVLPFNGPKVYLEQSTNENSLQLGWRSFEEYEMENIDNEMDSEFSSPVYLGTSSNSNLFAAVVSEPTTTNPSTTKSPGSKPFYVDEARRGAFYASRDALSHLSRPRPTDDLTDTAESDGSELSTFLWAQSLLKHRLSFVYCPTCATKLTPRHHGRHSACLACTPARDYYPRVDPVVITLIVDRSESESLSSSSVLLCRLPTSPKRRYSCVAGFLEPGESVEACVRREAQEEVGVVVGRVRYLCSEAWPTEVGSNLMIGCVAEVNGKDFTVNREELEDARWFTKREVSDIFEKRIDEFILPEHYTTAYKLLRSWVNHNLA
jgi:NADH pyrophosphatase NudC (nudix superfamily)